jgi:hypothetical protein
VNLPFFSQAKVDREELIAQIDGLKSEKQGQDDVITEV